MNLGFFHIYYGSGVGKTTRAVGLAVRAAGSGLKVNFVQFMKSGTSAEIEIFNKIPEITYSCPGKHSFIKSDRPTTKHFEHAEKALKSAFEAVEKETDILICDEILDTLTYKLLEKKQLLDLVERCKDKTELVMTGRGAPPEIMEKADYATEFVKVKHPYENGVAARKGIEY